jgi:hypothetical protein
MEFLTDLKAILHSKRANIFYLEKCRVMPDGVCIEPCFAVVGFQRKKDRGSGSVLSFLARNDGEMKREEGTNFNEEKFVFSVLGENR